MPTLREMSAGTTLVMMALVVIILGISATVIYRLYFHPLTVIPGPRILAASGVTAGWKSHVSGTLTRQMPALHREYGPAVRIGPNHISLDGSIGWTQVYGRRPEFAKYPRFLFVDDHLSLLGASRDVHRRYRRQLGHAFSDASLAEQEEYIRKHVDSLVSRLAELADSNTNTNSDIGSGSGGGEFDIVQWLNFATFDIISDLTYSKSFGNLEGYAYHPWVRNFFLSIRGEALNRFVRFFPLLHPFIAVIGHRYLKGSRSSREDSTAQAQARMALGEKPEGSQRKDMTEYLMRKNRDGETGLSEAETIVNLLVLIGAGSETTATAMSGFFFYLGRNPDAYSHLTGEIRKAFGAEEDITMRAVAQLPYLSACIDEILRVYPPAAETPPRVSPGVEIDGKFIPKGTQVSVYQWATFRNPSNFHDPDAFRPQRWLPASHPLYESRFAHDNKASFKPFSYGVRDCIGKNLAVAEMRLVLARILWRFDFDLMPGQDDWHDKQKTFIVWEKGPLKIKLRARQGHTCGQ